MHLWVHPLLLPQTSPFRACLEDGGDQMDKDIRTGVWTCPSPRGDPKACSQNQCSPSPSHTPQASSISTHASLSGRTRYPLAPIPTLRGVLGALQSQPHHPWQLGVAENRQAVSFRHTSPASHQLSKWFGPVGLVICQLGTAETNPECGPDCSARSLEANTAPDKWVPLRHLL